MKKLLLFIVLCSSMLYSDSNIVPKGLNPNYSPSFDCSKVSTQSEKDICRSRMVSTLDYRLGNLYQNIKKSMPEKGFEALIKIQSDWVKNRNTACSTQSTFSEREQCLISIYNKRLDAFALISVQDTPLQDYESVYINGSGEARLRLAKHLYLNEGATKKVLKLIYKVIAENQGQISNAYKMLIWLHGEYLKEFKDISKEEIKKNHNSVGYLLWVSDLELEQVLPVLLKEASFLNPVAEITLSLFYQNTHDKRILSLFERCAKGGIPRCEEMVGKIYLNGWGVKQDIMRGINLLEKSQMEDAYLILADYYDENKDIKKHKSYLQQAFSLGNIPATYSLGTIAQDEKKYEEAIKYFKKVIEKDNTYYPAISELARMYIYGTGVKKDLVKAIGMLQIVLDNSTNEAFKKYANNNMGIAEYRLARKGNSEKNADKKKIFDLMKSAAMRNNVYAQYDLAQMYFNGEGVEKDDNQVVKWYKKAAIQGHSDAQVYLGLRYLQGRGVKKDKVKASYWAQESAQSGNPVGQALYATILNDTNKTEAISWMHKAADQGYAPAIKYFLDEKKN